MKYGFIQKLMWAGYKGTFKKQLSEALRESDPKAVMKEAHKKYKEILADVMAFERKKYSALPSFVNSDVNAERSNI